MDRCTACKVSFFIDSISEILQNVFAYGEKKNENYDLKKKKIIFSLHTLLNHITKVTQT